jgi:hypothetical protein
VMSGMRNELIQGTGIQVQLLAARTGAALVRPAVQQKGEGIGEAREQFSAPVFVHAEQFSQRGMAALDAHGAAAGSSLMGLLW